jgi:hypothetical protein
MKETTQGQMPKYTLKPLKENYYLPQEEQIRGTLR